MAAKQFQLTRQQQAHAVWNNAMDLITSRTLTQNHFAYSQRSAQIPIRFVEFDVEQINIVCRVFFAMKKQLLIYNRF